MGARDRRSTFAEVSDIDIDRPQSWQGRLFLTFDIDWAHDEVLHDTLELVRAADVPTTWFATHQTPFLAELQRRDACEVGVHPNFNPLLEGRGSPETAEAALDALLEVVPGATAVRSHCLVRSSRIEQLFHSRGLTHESNDLVPESSGIQLRPFRKLTGMTQVPYCWADEAAWAATQSDDFSSLSDRAGLVVFDFHPIHVFLNTESSERYERTREIHRRPDELIRHRFEGTGTRTRLLKLLGL